MNAPSASYLVAALLLFPIASASADRFGAQANQFDIEFVTIASPGNAADPQSQFTDREQEAEDLYEYDDETATETLIRRGKILNEQFAPGRFGAVAYEYRIGKHEISRDMILKANRLGQLGINLKEVAPAGSRQPDDQPATGVSWFEAARFVNWLNTSRGYPPAYKFTFAPGRPGYSPSIGPLQKWTSGEPGFNPANPWRNARAVYFLPDEHEWYKAAYYDPTSRAFRAYPTASDVQPSSVLAGTEAGTAVYTSSPVRVRPGTPVVSGPMTPASIYAAGGLSAFGTMGQGGNAREWVESNFDLQLGEAGPRTLKGGYWSRVNWTDPRYSRVLNDPRLVMRLVGAANTSDLIQSPTRLANDPRAKHFANGFRVASVPLSRFGPPGKLPAPAPLPNPPGPDYVSPYVNDEESVPSGYHDEARTFYLAVDRLWEYSAVPKAFKVALTPYSVGVVYADRDDSEKLIGRLTSEKVWLPVAGAMVQIDGNGDGVYEATRTMAAGDDASIELTTPPLPQKMGPHRIRARWLAPSGEWIVAETRIYVGMEPGISILDGAEYTNTFDVRVSLLAPTGSAGAIISNDGGFRRNPRVVEFAPVDEPRLPMEIDWTLAKADQGRGARLVYVRFVNENGDVLREHSSFDDIIYDVVPPVLAEAVLSAEPTSAAGRKAPPQITIQLKASDNRSGVAFMQLSRGERASSRGASTLKYSPRRNIPRAGGPVWVRVQDKAGNWSPWRRSVVKSKVIDRQPPKLVVTKPPAGSTPATRDSFFVVELTASDDVSPVNLSFRTKGPGQKNYSGWQTVALPGSGKSKPWKQRVDLNKTGLWQVDLRVFDAKGKVSPTRTVKVRRR